MELKHDKNGYDIIYEYIMIRCQYFLRRLILLGLGLVVSFLLPSLGSAASQYPTLNSIHKHHPGNKGNIQNSSGSRSAIVDCQSSRPAKSKPGKQVHRQNVTVAKSSFRKKLSSKSAIVMEADTGRVLYSHALGRTGQPASTIKILTGLISLKALGQDDWVYVSQRAAGMPRSKVYLRSGKSYRADDLINSVLLASANDASVALAEKVAGSEKVFAKLMTYKASKLGAKSTVCKNATGLTAKGQKSTVKDLAVLFKAAMENPDFASRMSRTKANTSFGKVLRNHNKALWRVNGTEGGKTGYTRAARQTYVGKFSRPEGDLLVAIMGSETMWDDVSRLVEYGFSKKRQQNAYTTTKEPTDSRIALVSPRLLDNRSGIQILSSIKKVSRM